MPGPRRPRVIVLSESEQAELVRLTRGSSVPAGVARRARIVLLAAEGVPVRHIGPRVGVSRMVVWDWLDRFRARRLPGLQDQPRPGRPRRFSPCSGAACHPPGL